MALLSVSKDFVVKHGLVVNTTATFLSTVNATSTNSGAVIVAGGVGISKDLYVGGTIFGDVEGTASTATNAYTVLVAPTSVNATYYPTIVNAISTSSAYEYTTSSFSINPFSGEVTLASTTGTVNPQTGALVVYGGVGIGQDLHVGGTLSVDGITSTGTVILSGLNDVTPRYALKIQSGGPGAKLAFRTSANPDFGVAQTIFDDNEEGYAPFKFNASEFHFNVAGDITGDSVQPDAVAITTAGNVLIQSTINAISTTTGALTVQGGVGIGGNLYIGGNFYAAGTPVLTTTTLATSFSGGTDILIDISTSTGILTINDIATLETVTARGNTTNQQIIINNTSESTSVFDGALEVYGGAGIAGTVNAFGILANNGGNIGVYDDFNTNYVGFRSSSTLSTSTVWVLPLQDGQAGQFLSTDGSKTLSWQDPVDSVYPPFPTGDYALDEAYPGEIVLIDAFGVSLQENFSCMNPEGVMLYEDLGILT